MCRRYANRVELRHVQEADEFNEEIACLTREKALPRSSKLFKFDSEIGKDGVVRVNGRINAVQIKQSVKSLAVLDVRNAFTRLCVDNVYRRSGHGRRERIANDVRQMYYALRLRSTVLHGCTFCRPRKVTPSVPAFGDLPAVRLDAYSPPFSSCGVDYFGPMIVTIGRRHEKSWGALYTCLTTRAVYLEFAASLTTDSAIMALRRMAARRGWAGVMYSDNETSFRGANAELRAAIKEWEPELREFALTRRMDWRYIHPGTPDQGGAWERLVWSVKTALSVTLHNRAPKEEILLTLLAEAEYTINARPLTHVSADPAEPEALTPDHFLLGQPKVLPIIGTCESTDRRQWRAAQALADSFWRRWIRKYLPQLIPCGSPSDSSRNLAVGDLVLIVDSTLPRNVWPRGEVVKIYPGTDGIVRSVQVRTRGGIFRRPARKLAVLPK
ncbi:uncharacterized protein LOC113229725 [Hyposmocoma kahamanoa]|uniref:uncharacterized protein LOC113229725 n=1 Tax=Hyposmocoma kahamanoa TaxID=1477025 RepID=UPI000E6D7E1E|nr:uncharacterized protein LOC113229725 [Hyposmocoma kahamanoa]